MNRSSFLDSVKKTLSGRGKEYGDSKTGQASFEFVALLWSRVFGHKVTAAQVLLCMILLKISRLLANNNHHDSLADLVGYAALLAEELGTPDEGGKDG